MSLETDSLLEPASCGHLMNCSFWHLDSIFKAMRRLQLSFKLQHVFVQMESTMTTLIKLCYQSLSIYISASQRVLKFLIHIHENISRNLCSLCFRSDKHFNFITTYKIKGRKTLCIPLFFCNFLYFISVWQRDK